MEYYHSATPELGHDYGQKVYAVLPEETKLAYAAEPLPLAGGWAMTPNRSLADFADATDRACHSSRNRSRRGTDAGTDPQLLPISPGPNGLQTTLTIPRLIRVPPQRRQTFRQVGDQIVNVL